MSQASEIDENAHFTDRNGLHRYKWMKSNEGHTHACVYEIKHPYLEFCFSNIK